MKLKDHNRMNHKTLNSSASSAAPTRLWRYGIGGMLLACGTMIDHRMVAAPSVISNPVPGVPLQTQDQQSQTNDMQVFSPGTGLEEAGQSQPTLPGLFRWGRCSC